MPSLFRPVLLTLAAVSFLAGPAFAQAVRNPGLGAAYDDLAEALAAARDGDTIEVEGGVHVGNFLVDRDITLIGTGPEVPVLDGGGAGTVLTVRADGVTVENLMLTNAGRDPNPWLLWGDAAVLVDDADGVVLRGLEVRGNDWGIVLRLGEGSLVETSTVEDNERHGIVVLGGRSHRISSNSVNRNGVGIRVDALFTEERESPLARLGSPDAAQLLAQQKLVARRSGDVVVDGNEVRGNAMYGIEVAWESERITVSNNHVHLTGIERPVDQQLIDAWERSASAGTGVPVSLDRSAYGSGIFLFCLVTDSLVMNNRSHDNHSAGIGLSIVNRNAVVANEVSHNATGISIQSSDENRIEANLVAGNADYGIRIAVSNVLATPSSDNLLTLNDLKENGINAFDSSGRRLSADDLEEMLDTLPFPPEVQAQMRANPQLRRMLLQSYQQALQPATNRWDDGTRGNRYDDFDEHEEGFVDEDSDGISERPHPIPGGSSVDHHPLGPGGAL